MRQKQLRWLTAILLVSTSAAWAEDADATWKSEAGNVELTGGVGIVHLEANEVVYATTGSSDRISHLIWQSTAPMLTGTAVVTLPEGWSITTKAQAAIGGGYMEDYDWFGPFFVSYDEDDWTHRSLHEATDLDWYFNGSVLLGRDVFRRENVTINLNGGFKYTDVQWTGHGGDFTYSMTGYRADEFTIADSVKGITYRQQFPAFVLGVDSEIVRDRWTFDLSAHGGLTFNAKDDDHHWLRDLNFIEHIDTAPLLAVGAAANYEVKEGVSLFLAATAEKVFTARADTDIYNLAGTFLGAMPDAAGADLFAASISGGIKGTF